MPGRGVNRYLKLISLGGRDSAGGTRYFSLILLFYDLQVLPLSFYIPQETLLRAPRSKSSFVSAADAAPRSSSSTAFGRSSSATKGKDAEGIR